VILFTISTVSLSAGNNISSASSERVTSLAVPNTVTVFKKDTVPKRVDIRSGVARRCEPSKLSGASEPAGTAYPATSERGLESPGQLAPRVADEGRAKCVHAKQQNSQFVAPCQLDAKGAAPN